MNKSSFRGTQTLNKGRSKGPFSGFKQYGMLTTPGLVLRRKGQTKRKQELPGTKVPRVDNKEGDRRSRWASASPPPQLTRWSSPELCSLLMLLMYLVQASVKLVWASSGLILILPRQSLSQPRTNLNRIGRRNIDKVCHCNINNVSLVQNVVSLSMTRDKVKTFRSIVPRIISPFANTNCK